MLKYPHFADISEDETLACENITDNSDSANMKESDAHIEVPLDHVSNVQVETPSSMPGTIISTLPSPFREPVSDQKLAEMTKKQ